MRANALLLALVGFLSLGSGCRSTSAQPADASTEGSPTRTEASREAQVEAPSAVEPARQPLRETSPAAAAQEAPRPVAAPVAPVEPNRDRHAGSDVGAYIAHLESASRVAELRIDTVLEKLSLPIDAWLGDLGCGPGAFTIAFAKACPDGVVFASDVEPRQLDVVLKKLRANAVANVVPVLASDDDPHFPQASLDVVFVCDTYHHLENRVDYMRRLSKTLKPGGRLVILEYKPGKLEVGPPPERKLKPGEMVSPSTPSSIM